MAVTAWTSSTPKPMSRQCWPVPAPSATSASCPASTRRCTRGRPHASSGKGGWSATWVRCIRNWRRNSTSSSRCSSSSCCWPKWSTVTCRSSASLSRFPEVRRDLALLVDQDVPAQDILTQIRAAAGEWLTDLRLFDVYHGKGIDPHRKSLAVGLTWQHPSRTLNDDEVNSTTQNIVTSLEERFNATLRK